MKSTGDIVVIEGFAEFRRDLKRLNPELEKELKVGLKSIGGIAARSAADVAMFKFKKNTPGRGIAAMLRKPGASTVQAKSVTVVAKAKRRATDGSRLAAAGKRSRYFGKAFPYPLVHEYGGRVDGNVLGPRAFLHPGVDKATPEVMRELGEVIDKTARKAGFK
jgi:hypothetical protein